MRKLLYLSLFLFFVFGTGHSSANTIKEMKFEEVPLSVVIKALAKVSDKNIMIDPDVKDVLGTKVSIYVKEEMPLEEVFNVILKEYDLIVVPVDGGVYKITKAGRFEADISRLDEEGISELLDLLKTRVSPSAEIVIDKKLGVLVLRDEEKLVKSLSPKIMKFIEDLLAQRRIGFPETKEKEKAPIITRVFYLKTLNVYQAKEMLQPYFTEDTVVTESPTFNALVITDSADKIAKYEEVLKDFLVTAPTTRKPVTHIFYLKYIRPQEFIKMIEPIRSEAGVILSGGAVKTTQQATGQKGAGKGIQTTPIIEEFNAVMITDYPEVIEKIKEQFGQYISDVPPQVKIEAKILQVDKSVTRELGINWSAILSNTAVPETMSGGIGSNLGIGDPLSPVPGQLATEGGILTFTYSRGILNALNLRISAFEKIGKVKSLAKPTIVTISGQSATIKQGTEIPYQTTVVAGGAGVPTVSFKQAVLSLDVLPIISPDGRVLLDIKLTKDTVGEDTPVGPAIDKNELQTKVIVNDGDTLVIGGIIDSSKTNTISGVPGAIRVPILKWIFGQETKVMEDKELLIFLTPTILYD